VGTRGDRVARERKHGHAEHATPQSAPHHQAPFRTSRHERTPELRSVQEAQRAPVRSTPSGEPQDAWARRRMTRRPHTNSRNRRIDRATREAQRTTVGEPPGIERIRVRKPHNAGIDGLRNLPFLSPCPVGRCDRTGERRSRAALPADLP
jgi:hypothetical protein